MKKFLILAAAAAGLLSTSANAAVFNFTLNTAIGNGSGSFTTASDAPGFNLISALTGTFDGGAITLLAPNSYPVGAANDNLYNVAAPFLTFNGFSFLANGNNYNVYAQNGVIRACGVTPSCNGNQAATFDVTPGAVPEPASWAMMIGGLGIVGVAMRRRATTVAFA